jgi:hypothetical protein
LETWKDAAVVVATWGGDVVNLEGSTGPWQVVQALREQSGISTPIRATLWLRPGEHPLSEQVVDENGAVAIWTRSARSQGSAEQVAGFAAADADEPLAALAALIDRVIDECLAALKCLAHRC